MPAQLYSSSVVNIERITGHVFLGRLGEVEYFQDPRNGDCHYREGVNDNIKAKYFLSEGHFYAMLSQPGVYNRFEFSDRGKMWWKGISIQKDAQHPLI